jgi:exosome complex component RRP40
LCKKAWNSGEAFFGELSKGLLKDFPVNFCLSLVEDPWVLQKLGAKFVFNVNVGFNGKIWVKSDQTAHTIFVMKALERAVTDSREEVDRLIN